MCSINNVDWTGPNVFGVFFKKNNHNKFKCLHCDCGLMAPSVQGPVCKFLNRCIGVKNLTGNTTLRDVTHSAPSSTDSATYLRRKWHCWHSLQHSDSISLYVAEQCAIRHHQSIPARAPPPPPPRQHAGLASPPPPLSVSGPARCFPARASVSGSKL